MDDSLQPQLPEMLQQWQTQDFDMTGAKLQWSKIAKNTKYTEILNQTLGQFLNM
jgi:chitodextrinase